jgi:hypothetical protein
MGKAPPPPTLQLLEHHAVWLEDLFELSNNSEASIHRRVRVIYFYSSGNATNLHNRELRKREKRGMSNTEMESIQELSGTYRCAMSHATNKNICFGMSWFSIGLSPSNFPYNILKVKSLCILQQEQICIQFMNATY